MQILKGMIQNQQQQLQMQSKRLVLDSLQLSKISQSLKNNSRP